jgi:predicted membrane protein
MANEFHRSSRGLSVGLFIIAIGLVFLLDQEGVVSADYMFRFFWPAIFLFFGLEAALCREGGNRRIFGIVLTSIGALLLLSRVGFLRFHIGFELIWPAMLIWAGVWIILRAFRQGEGRGPVIGWVGPWVARMHQGSADPSDSQFDLVAVFGGVKRRITSQSFKGGSVMTFCGGFHIDLTRANIEGESATINASSCMGGGEIRVPDTWIIDMQGLPLFGGFVDETHQIEERDPTKQKRLFIRGTTLMGGIVVKN